MFQSYPEVDALDGRTIVRDDGNAYAFARPKVPVNIGAWSIFCPKCDESGRARNYGGSGIDFNHEHRELPDYPRFDGTGGPFRDPTIAERNYLALYLPDNLPMSRWKLTPEED